MYFLIGYFYRALRSHIPKQLELFHFSYSLFDVHSVKPDKPLTAQDIMNMNRDQYEGTQFDLTNEVASGPFGDPMRWPEMSKWEDETLGVSRADMSKGEF
jgi:hypothetical protein